MSELTYAANMAEFVDNKILLIASFNTESMFIRGVLFD